MIDIRDLRINNTVWFNDKRVKITAIDNMDDEPFVKTNFRDDKWLHAKLIDPIPITQELLKELGFEVRVLTYKLKAEIEIDEFFISLDKVKNADFFELYIYNQSLRESQNMLVRDLHTLQNFVFITTKKELKYDKSNQY